jgi:glycosyltransferase involved in cell wall biosynthesis
LTRRKATAESSVVLFIPSYGDGGVERNFVYLASGLAAAGYSVTLMAGSGRGVFLDRLHPGVQLYRTEGSNDRELVAELIRFLASHPTAVVMTGQQRDDRIALLAKSASRATHTRFILNVGTPLSQQSRESHWFWPKRWWHRRGLRALFSRCDGIIANSRGVAEDLSGFLGIPLARIAVAPNPAVAPDLGHQVGEPVSHPWLLDPSIPVIMGAGRLGRVKDFPTLLRAFALLRASRPCRLMILGRGRQQARLERLARELGVERDFELTGFIDNPYAYLARAAVFTVTSLREGGPNVLIEALACGTPVVATDCPHGPREILQGGQYGPLVPVGDSRALAEAIDAVLCKPPAGEWLREAAAPYSIERSTASYVMAFGLPQHSDCPASALGESVRDLHSGLVEAGR